MIDRLTVKYHEEVVGILSLTPDNKLCASELSFHAMIPSFHAMIPSFHGMISSFHAVFSLRQRDKSAMGIGYNDEVIRLRE